MRFCVYHILKMRWLRSQLGFFYSSKVKFTIVSVVFNVTGFSHFMLV